MHVLFLTKDNLELAKTESERLLELESLTMNTLKEDLLIMNINKNHIKNKKYSRLAYARKLLELLFICNPKSIAEALESYEWKCYKKDFCLRIHNINEENQSYKEADYAKYIWRSLEKKNKNPKVNLKNPETFIEIIILDNKAFVCLKIWENTEDFESRKAHQRPEMHPTGMHPKMARALVNILNPKLNEKVLDPFCGTGGIMLEAGLMGIKSVGYDISPVVLKMAKINLKHYGINEKMYSLKKKDFMTLKNFKNVATDLPYGKSSKAESDIKKLYTNFIKRIDGKCVVIFPDFINYKKLLKENLNKKLEVKKIIKQFVHKSLTRNIVVIE
jgi:tRNA (guanine10-N2)-dimethyltransferase